MSDPTIKKTHAKSQGNVEDLREYESNKSLQTSTELLVEFLSSIMIKDYEMALKYCTEILRHEPANTTALEFYPLIVEKLEMIKNEELESTSSETSLSSSSMSSSSSENILFHKEFLDKSTNDCKSNFSKRTKILPTEKINDCISSNPVVSEKEPANENKTAADSSIPLVSKQKNNFVSLQKEELNMKVTGNVTTPLPSNLLIHPTQTTTLIGKNASNVPTKTPPRPKKEKKTASALKKQPSKLLLHTTRTITFPKRLPPSKFCQD